LTRALARLPRVQPAELAELMALGTPLLVVDVRATAAHDLHGERIPGARHLELASIAAANTADWPADCEIVTYCACPNDVSALRAAHLLSQRGFRVRALAGGIDGWSEAGYRLEAVPA